MRKIITGIAAATLFAGSAFAQSSPGPRSSSEQDQTSTIRQDRPKDAVAPPTSPSGSQAGSRSAGEMTQDSDSVLPQRDAK